MQYFVGYLAEGEASDYYKTLTSDLEQRFGIKNLSNFIPPHFTFRIPFETEKIEEFEQYVDQLTSNVKPVGMSINGFDKLEGKRMTIFLSATSESMDTLEGIIDSLEQYDGANKTPKRPLILHTSIARFLSPEQCGDIWNYLQTLPTPQFNLKFDNLTIFKLVEENWEVYKIFRFQ
jgi:2'-5' RNA ligase